MKPPHDLWDYSRIPQWMHVKFDAVTGGHEAAIIHWQAGSLLCFEPHVCVEAAVALAHMAHTRLVEDADALDAVTRRLKS